MSFPPSAAPLTDVQRVLCVLAHPDDVDFGSAGTVATWVDAGIEVAYLLVTRGDAGGFDDTPREQMPALREAEQRAAAAVVGVKQVEFLEGYRDGVLEPTIGLRRDITAAIRRFRPDRILTSSPLRRWDRIAGPSHPDHLAAGEATTCAVYPDARNPFTFTDIGLEPWTVREIWYSGGPNPDYFVDVTDVFPRKLAALRAHVSQTSHLDGFDEMLRGRHAMVAKAGGLPDGRLAEGYSIFATA
ncbi:PIG-L deacetylase family protein [Dactylosporangium sp. NPDC051484]|uniref:PIG-L deacetylase family protein n=1 Tax=Dactylosporangium sp. NPDC051484 TaxID=3154942 RepID=UPI00344BD693